MTNLNKTTFIFATVLNRKQLERLNSYFFLLIKPINSESSHSRSINITNTTTTTHTTTTTTITTNSVFGQKGTETSVLNSVSDRKYTFSPIGSMVLSFYIFLSISIFSLSSPSDLNYHWKTRFLVEVLNWSRRH